MFSHLPQDFAERAQQIKLAVFDVDGVLSDGQLYFMADGSEAKAFSTLDGQGMKLLQQSGVELAIITGRASKAVEHRVKNLGINYLYQAREDKITALNELLADLDLSYAQVAYLGDDLPDLAVIRRVGIGAAVNNAHFFVKQHAYFTTHANGGFGAAREFCDALMYGQGTLDAVLQRYL